MIHDALNIFCDGGARGNPGPAAVGIVVKDEKGTVITSFSEKIGVATNNVAEYQAVIRALTFLKQNQIKAKNIKFHLDSKVVAKQLSYEYKVKENHLKELLFKVRLLEQKVGGEVTYTFIPRELNILADSLLNQALGDK